MTCDQQRFERDVAQHTMVRGQIPLPYAYEITNTLGELELIYADNVTPEELAGHPVALYRVGAVCPTSF